MEEKEEQEESPWKGVQELLEWVDGRGDRADAAEAGDGTLVD